MRRMLWATCASFSLHALVLLALLWHFSIPHHHANRQPPARTSLHLRLLQSELPSLAPARERPTAAQGQPTQKTVERPATETPAGRQPQDAESSRTAQDLAFSAPNTSTPDHGFSGATRSMLDAQEAMRRQMDMQRRAQRVQALWMQLNQELFMPAPPADGHCLFVLAEDFMPQCANHALQQWADRSLVQALSRGLHQEGAGYLALEISISSGRVSVQTR